jgi:hypothetical protein
LLPCVLTYFVIKGVIMFDECHWHLVLLYLVIYLLILRR